MTEIWKSQTPEIHKSWLDAIMTESSEELTDWETRFIDSIERRLSAHNPLTQYQEQKLEEIYAERTK